jgi:hypothetical protein
MMIDMRTATLYSTEQKRVTLYSDYIPYHLRGPVRVINSDDILCKDEISHVHHLPVERWIRNGEEFFIALDPKLRDLVGCMIRTSEDAVRSIAQVRINKLNDEINLLRSRTMWDMIKLKFRRKK